MSELSEGQQTILDALRAVYDRDGRCTYRAIAAEAYCSLDHAHSTIGQLLDLGYAEQSHSMKGTLRPARYGRAVFVPLLTPEQVAARFAR